MLKHKLSKIVFFLMSYLGLTNRELSHRTVHIVLGVAWEELVFFGLPITVFGAIVVILSKAFPIANQWLFLSLWLVAFFLWTSFLTYVFAIFHQPGHFFTEFKLYSAKKLLRKMEAAWLWQNYPQAQRLAAELLALANELWELSGSEYSNFLRYLSLYVLCHKSVSISPSDNKRLLMQKLEDIVELYPNEILS